MQSKKIVKNPKIVVSELIDGDLPIVIEDILDLGMQAMNLFELPCMNVKEAKQNLGDRIFLWCNIDLVTPVLWHLGGDRSRGEAADRGRRQRRRMHLCHRQQ